MPKDKEDRKKKLEDSDSDSSGPTDRTPVAKKPKTDSSAATASKGKGDEEPSWELGNTKFVKVNTFKGQVYVNIREFYDDGGTLKPGKKGISLSATQWQKLRGIIEEVNEAVQNA